MARKILIGLFLVVLATAPSWANPVNVRPVVLGSGDTPTLQTVFTSIGSTINVNTDQDANAIFTGQGSGASIVTLVIEVAGNAGTNTFGIYKFGDTSTTLQVFSGPDATPTQHAISFFADGTVKLDFGAGGTVAGFGNLFGFYLGTTAGPTFYTEDSLNPAGAAQALMFKGKNDFITIPLLAGGRDGNHYYVAFEDVALAGSDEDYNDFVAIIESISPVPEPGSLLLLGSGLIGLAGVARRRFGKK